MTGRANDLLEQLRLTTYTKESLVKLLRASDLRPSECGWVLYHLCDVPMAEGVHLCHPDTLPLDTSNPEK